MTPPDYFFADLPQGAELTAAMITEACQALRRNRDHYLANRSTQSLIEILSRVAEEWVQSDYRFRKLALDQGAQETGFAPATLCSGLDAFFGQLTPENLEGLVSQELGHQQRLDRFVATEWEEQSQRRSLAVGPRLLVHVTAGNLPNPALMS